MKNYLFILALLTTGLFITSCSNDDDTPAVTCTDGIQNGSETGIDCGGVCEPCVTTVEEDKANIQMSFDDMLQCATDLKSSRAVTVFFKDFLNLSDGDALNEDWIEGLTGDLEYVFDFDHIEDNSRLDLNYHEGTYSYNSADNSWLKESNLDDIIVFKFPGSPSATTKNVEIGVDLYTDKQVVIDGESISLPTAMHGYINVDGTKAFEVSISDVVYADNANYQLPVEVSAQFFMDPMEMDINVKRNSTTSYEMSMTFSDDNICDVGINAEMNLKDDDFENLSENSLEDATVRFDIGELSIRTLGDLASLIAIDDPTDQQVNDLLDLTVFFEDLKIADLEVNQDDETFIIFYKDGTSEDSIIFYEGFWEDVEAVWNEFFG